MKLSMKSGVSRTRVRGHTVFHGRSGWVVFRVHGTAREGEEIGGVIAVSFEPAIKLATSCEHIAGERHRFALFDGRGLARDFGGLLWRDFAGLQVGSFGIVLTGHVATDVHAVCRNVIWEDEHCWTCCGVLLRFVETFDQGLLTRCGPTIEAGELVVPKRVGSLTDEYWTD